MSDDIAQIAAKLDPLQVEWLTGWQGVQGAAYNAVATSLRHMGLLGAYPLRIRESRRDNLVGSNRPVL
jgi:hypothetical protein